MTLTDFVRSDVDGDQEEEEGRERGSILE